MTSLHVRGVEWLLVVASLLVAATSLFVRTLETMAAVAWALAGLSVVLAATTARGALRTRRAGKFFLAAGCFVFYWAEAANLSVRDARFQLPSPALGALHVTPSLLAQAFLAVALFQAALFAGYAIRPPVGGIARWLRSRVDTHDLPSVGWKAALALAGLFSLGLAYRFSPSLILAALVEPHETGGIDGIYLYGYALGIFGSALCLADAFVVRSRRGLARLGLALVGLAGLVPFVFRGTRHHMIFLGVPLLVAALALSAPRARGRPPVSLGRVAVLAAILVLILQLQVILRGFGWTETENVTSGRLLDVLNFGEFGALLFALALVPAQHPYFLEPVTPYFLLHWIPRPLWADKPVLESWAWYNDQYLTFGTTEAFNVTPSVIGQFHLSWGPLGILLIGVWLGFLARSLDALLDRLDVRGHVAATVVLGSGYAFVIASFRFYHPLYSTYVVFALVGLLLTTQRLRPAARSANPTVRAEGAPP